ncbi:MAG: GGDEF domain-containing protein [Gemmatimonadota bacterium]|nr:MAG: GGDEF domain-containing protein [Gemmatimonadota bacterium]
MPIRKLKHVLSWVAPGGLVMLAAVAWVHLSRDPESLANLARGYPYAIFGAGALLAWRFHRSRVVAAVLALALAEALLRLDAGGPAQIARTAATFLLPAVLAALALTRDRGVLTARGLTQLAVVLLPTPALAMLLRYQEAQATQAVPTALIEPAVAVKASIPQPELLVFAVSITVAASVAVRRRKAVEIGFLWAVVATCLALSASPGGAVSTVYLMAGGLVLGLSVVETGYSMAYRDELTGLPSRRALPAALAELRNRYSIAMVDIDHFKRFNDKHGHDVGDQVLRMVAAKLARVSGGGRAFRYGGEEFAVTFPGKTRDEALPHLEDLRTEIEEAGFTVRGRRRLRKKTGGGNRRSGGGKRLTITVSIGVAERNGRNTTAERVLTAADKALYRAKGAGRNRVSS